MRVLIISANTLPASPSGAAYIAGAVLEAGHTVEAFECLFAKDLGGELRAHIMRFKPDVVGISIRLVHGFVIDKDMEFNTRHLDLRIRVKEIVDCIRQVSDAYVVLGGPGFNYYGPDWLEYLNLKYGIRGEADFSFPLFLKRLGEGGDIATIPGCVFRRDGQIYKVPRKFVKDLNRTAFPAYELFDLEKYDEHNISPAILTKRGCAFHCTYCPYASLEGNRYRLKSPARIVAEIEKVQKACRPRMFMICDNNFNAPRRPAEAICQEFIEGKLDIQWGTGDLRPTGVTDEFCRLLRESGCTYVNLSIESGSDAMLKCMERGYFAAQIRKSLASLDKAKIPFGASLMFGAPGETSNTIAESLSLLEAYEIPLGVWVTIGICLWTHRQKILETAQRDGQFIDEKELFLGVNYISPELPKAYMIELIASLKQKRGYKVQVNKPYAGYSLT